MNTLQRNKILSEDFLKLPTKAEDKVAFWQCKHIADILIAAPIKVEETEKRIIVMKFSDDYRKRKAAVEHGIKFTYQDENELMLLLSCISLEQ